MALLSPFGLLWLASVPVLLWLWRLASSQRRIQIPSLVPFEHLLQRPPTSRSRLVVNLLFWLQLAALTLLVLAVTQPVLWSPPAKTTLVLVDTSASMGARVHGRRTFEQTRQLLHARLSRKRPADRWLLMTSAPAEAVTRQPTSDPSQLRQAVNGLSINDLGGDLATAARLGRALLGGYLQEVLVVTDEPRPPSLPPDGIEFLSVGEPLSNVAIVGIETPGAVCQETALRVLVNVQNFSNESITSTVSAQQGGRRIAQTQIALSSRAQTTVPLALPEDADGWVSVHVEAAPDALAVDDTAHVRLRRTSTLPVAIVSEDEGFQRLIGHWLTACEGLRWTTDWSTLTEGSQLVVTDRSWLPEREVTGVLRFLRPEASAGVQLAHWMVQTDHPLASYLPSLHPVAAALETTAQQGWPGVPVVWGLFEGKRQPVVLASETHGRRTMSVLIDPVASAQSTPLLMLFFNGLQWLMGSGDMVATGEPLVLAALAAGPVAIRRPDGAVERMLHAGGAFRYDATTRSGLYQVMGPQHEITLAANFLDPRESNVMDRTSTWRQVSVDPLSTPRDARLPWPLTNSLLWLMLILWLCEWWLSSRQQRRSLP